MPKIFDRVAVESWQRDEIVQKFPREGLGDIKLGSQLIVNPGEMAVFVAVLAVGLAYVWRVGALDWD